MVEVHRRVEVAEATSECLKGALTRAETNLASKKEREADTMKAKGISQGRKESRGEGYGGIQAFKNFAAEKACAVAIFCTSGEFYTDRRVFNEAFKEGYKLGKFDCHTRVAV